MRKASILLVGLCVAWFLTSCKSKVAEKPKGPEQETEEKESPAVQASRQDAMLNEPLARESVPEKLRDSATMVCKTCGWHVKADVESCPHCEASGEFKRERAFYPEFFRPWKWCLLLNGDEVWASGWGGIGVYSLKEMREVRRITEDDGLHSSFLGFGMLCKDDDGSIWLSGGGIPESGIFGLSKWDGDKWIPYTADVGLTPRNIGTYGLVCTLDSVWGGGPMAGVVRIRPRWTKKTKGGPWRRYWTGNFDLISCDNVMDIIVDRDDPTYLWLALYDFPEGGDIGGKWRRPPWNEGEKVEWPGGLAKFKCNPGREEGFWTSENSECPTGRALALAEDSKGRIWFGGDEPSKGIGCLDKKSGQWTIHNESSGCLIKTAWGIVVDAKDNVWFTHGRDPIYRFDGESWTAFEPEFPGKGKTGVPGGHALLVLENGNFIVSTEYGLLLYDAGAKSWQAFKDLPYPEQTAGAA